jgi:hypothetical protein
MLEMETFRMVFAENQDVTEVDENERKGTKKGIHEALECLGSILEAKGCEIEFKKSRWSEWLLLS